MTRFRTPTLGPRVGGGGSGSGGLVLIGGAASTLIGFTDQTITAGSGYVGVFHDQQNFLNGDINFDGTNLTLFDGSAQGIWYYGANGKIVGTPGSGVCRVVIAGLVSGGLYAGELSRLIIPASLFSEGYVGYSIFATARIALGDNMGVYIDNQTDVSLTIEQGDPNDGSGPPACQVHFYLLNFQVNDVAPAEGEGS